MRRSKTIFVVSDKSLGGGEAVVSGGLVGIVLEKVTGTFPLLFVLFLLFSLGELGITREVICGSLGLVFSSSLGVVICCSPGGAIDRRGLCGSEWRLFFANHHPEITVFDGLHPRMPQKSVMICAVALRWDVDVG
jgi:hypothetical protein